MKIILCLFTASALSVSPLAAHAKQACGARDTALTQLEKQFEEKVLGRGLVENGSRMIELFVSESGSWTMLASDPTASAAFWRAVKIGRGQRSSLASRHSRPK